jgi:hypothetical protein
MAKVILEFDPLEEREEMESAIKGSYWKFAVRGLYNELFKQHGYGLSILGGDITDMEIEIMEKQLEIFGEVLEKYDLKI